jgi:hypothetical protein
MRWREALGMDDRIAKNLEAVSAFATAVDTRVGLSSTCLGGFWEAQT